jgi:hypothetical protein
MAVTLKVRQTPRHGWVTNFSRYGWKVRYNGAWLQMTPTNTKVRSADGTSWLSVQ